MAYLTVEEMRKNPAAVEDVSRAKATGGTRFEGSTDVEAARKYLLKNEPVLECGPVFGEFTKFLQDNGFKDVHSLDFVDLRMFPDKQRMTFGIIDFNFEKIPYKDNFFGSVAAWGIGEHLENPFHFAREVHRVLRPGGIFLFSLPNVFHIVSRLIFLKRGMFPRWNNSNNHISVLPHGIFEKTFLRYFDLVETKYIKPSVQLPFISKISKRFPKNQWFGNYVVYVLKKR